MDQDSTHMVVASKFPMLKPGESELWRMRIEQYILMIDYALWKVIENGATLPKTAVVEGVEKVMPITSAEDKAQRRLEVKVRTELETISMDDLYNNLKVYEPEVKRMSSSSSSTQNMAFVSSSNNNTSSSNKVVNAAHGVTTASTQVNTAYFTNINNLSDASSKEQDCKNKESSKRNVPVETPTSIALVSCDGLGGYDWSDQAEEGPNYALMAYSSSSSDSEVSNDSTCSKSCLETVKLLKSQYDQLLKDFKKSELMVLGYKTDLESMEERLEFYKKNESVYEEKIKGLKWDIPVGEITIGELRKKLEIV
ncbi:hypothetical protein Tco_0844176 [Tanacetum coccineum]